MRARVPQAGRTWLHILALAGVLAVLGLFYQSLLEDSARGSSDTRSQATQHLASPSERARRISALTPESEMGRHMDQLSWASLHLQARSTLWRAPSLREQWCVSTSLGSRQEVARGV